MRAALERLVGLLGRDALPVELDESLAVLERSAWPEVVERWSGLTPTSFPIEVACSSADGLLRWVAEVAGPEVPEARRLELAAARAAARREPLAPDLLEALLGLQRGRELHYGAWIGGRSAAGGAARSKLYVELPAGVGLEELPLPRELREVCVRVPDGSRALALGVEPARQRIELYLGLPARGVECLRQLLSAAGQPRALETLERRLPGGLRRLSGRQLWLSLAVASEPGIEVALFVPANSFFPGEVERLRELLPSLAQLPAGVAHPTVLTLRLGPDAGSVSYGLGLVPAPARTRAACDAGVPAPSFSV